MLIDVQNEIKQAKVEIKQAKDDSEIAKSQLEKATTKLEIQKFKSLFYGASANLTSLQYKENELLKRETQALKFLNLKVLNDENYTRSVKRCKIEASDITLIPVQTEDKLESQNEVIIILDSEEERANSQKSHQSDDANAFDKPKSVKKTSSKSSMRHSLPNLGLKSTTNRVSKKARRSSRGYDYVPVEEYANAVEKKAFAVTMLTNGDGGVREDVDGEYTGEVDEVDEVDHEAEYEYAEYDEYEV